jgi:hypothetical protein
MLVLLTGAVAIGLVPAAVTASTHKYDAAYTSTTSPASVATATAVREPTSTGSSGRAGVVFRSFNATEGIATPYGVAEQGADAGSQALKGAVEDGATVYRQGSLGVQQTGEGQFWAGENPLTTPNYAAGYGMPGSASPDWVMGGEVNPGEPFVTREAPGLGGNEGGNPEVVTRPGGVGNLWFHMP